MQTHARPFLIRALHFVHLFRIDKCSLSPTPLSLSLSLSSKRNRVCVAEHMMDVSALLLLYSKRRSLLAGASFSTTDRIRCVCKVNIVSGGPSGDVDNASFCALFRFPFFQEVLNVQLSLSLSYPALTYCPL